MKATVFSHKEPIGTADLQPGDISMGCLSGVFIPNDYYFAHIQTSVRAFCENGNTDYSSRESLRLNVQLENGHFLFPAGGCALSDIKELPDELIQLDLGGLDRYVMEAFSAPSPELPFPGGLWDEIDIQQKLAFEDQLHKELGTREKKTLFRFFRSGDHVLSDFEFSAAGKYACNDDVLFSVRKRGDARQLAVVHLTWSSGKKSGSFPSTDFYKDLNEFREQRMYPDNTEWEN